VKLQVKGVEFHYDSRPVLRDVSLALGEGELLGIIGPNGAGKSTLLRCINRILEPQVGSILIDGKEIGSLDRIDLAKKLARVPQQEDRRFPTTVFDAVLMGRKPHGAWRPVRGDEEIVSRIIAMLELEELAMRDVDEISGGERQKVMIARALAQNADVLLLDEPTSNLDLRHQVEILDIVRDQLKTGLSAIMAIHDVNLASRYSDKLLILHEGSIFDAGGPEIITRENMEAVYRVKVGILHHASGRRVVVPEGPLVE